MKLDGNKAMKDLPQALYMKTAVCGSLCTQGAQVHKWEARDTTDSF